MELLKIDFIDFWPDFDKTNNFFFKLLTRRFNVVLDSEKPDLIFFSVFGIENLKFNCKRIFFSGENVIPDFSICDLAFSFNYINNTKYFRLPLYSIYYDDFLGNKIISNEIKNISIETWENKKKFCCMVVSNPKSSKRIEFFKKLNSFKHVDSGGAVLNNIGGRVKDKLKFIKDYKFVLAFENEISDGYTTEKLLEPIIQQCIPIYWGNKNVDKDFNPKRFINHSDFDSEEDLINEILSINKDPQKAIKIVNQPFLSEKRISFEEEKRLVLEKISQLVNSEEKPIGSTFWGKANLVKVKIKRSKYYKKIMHKINRIEKKNK